VKKQEERKKNKTDKHDSFSVTNQKTDWFRTKNSAATLAS